MMNSTYIKRTFNSHFTPFIFFALALFGCSSGKEERLSAFSVFCEMVANDAKPIALSHPMESAELDEVWGAYQVIAETYGVSLFRERDFPLTSLFPASATEGKEVLIIYRGSRLTQYLQFKKDLNALEEKEAARRFGRLLGYTAQGINELLMKNTTFKTLSSFEVSQQVTHLYYEDREEAIHFYGEVLGLPFEEGIGYKIGEAASIQLHATDERHPSDLPKSTAIALLTDQLPGWYAHVQANNVPIKYSYKPRQGGPHDGFVAIDPGGYLLEFEQFKQHPENELFMAKLEEAPRTPTSNNSLNFYGSITWTYHNDLLKMQRFYEDVLGYKMVADQGWTKIYQTSTSGFMGLVDERRGMMDYADEKAVEVEWKLSQRDGAVEYFSSFGNWEEYAQGMIGPEKYVYLLR